MVMHSARYETMYPRRPAAVGGSHGDPFMTPRSAASRGSPNIELTTAVISILFGVALTVFAIGYITDLHLPCMIGLLGVLYFGVGTAPVQTSRLSLAPRLGIAGIISLSVLTSIGTLMILVPIWHPLLFGTAIVATAAAVHIYAFSKLVFSKQWATVFRVFLDRSKDLLDSSIACSVIGTALWCATAVDAGHPVPGVEGFLPEVSPLWYAGVVCLLTGIVFARGKNEAYAMIALVSLVGAFTLTPALIYGMPPLSAAKHVDLVQQALQTHHLNRSASIYEAYCGFFSAIAWICDVARMRDSLTFAAYWPFIAALLTVVELRFFFGHVIPSRYRICICITLVILVIPIGDYYFSPQSVGFVMGLGFYGLVIGDQRSAMGDRMRTALLSFAGVALAVTHELSPYIVGGVIIVLVAFRVARPWYAPLTCILPAVLWAILNWHEVANFATLSNLGDLSNFAPPKTVSAPGLNRLSIVGESSDALLIGLLILTGLAGIGFFRGAFSRSTADCIDSAPAWASLISAGIGLFVIIVTPYGNEGIFRAALFGIPWLVLLASSTVPSVRPAWISEAFGLGALLLLLTQLISSFGLDNANIIRPTDFQAYAIYMADSSSDSYILDLSYGAIPSSAIFPKAGHLVAWTNVVPRATFQPGRPNSEDVANLARIYIHLAANNGGAPANQLYALWSPASVQYAVDYGLETFKQALVWRDLMATSRDWQVVFSRDGTYLFRVVQEHAPEHG
jgi:hypothetical protein